MKFVFASDSFKGTLSSRKTGRLLKQAALSVFPEAVCETLVVADGGEGTVEAVIGAVDGELLHATVSDPLFRSYITCYGKINDDSCIIEMAKASGLTLLMARERNPLYASSYGTGELILKAIKSGFTDITIAIGGSATNDGGIGCMRALGVRFLDANRSELEGRGQDLDKIASIDMTGLHPAIQDGSIRFTVMCDVDNPLCGPHGATYTFGPQKGADEAALDILEKGMCNYRDILTDMFGRNPDDMPGAGAAGGLGAALMLFLNARMQPGIEAVLDMCDFDHMISDADLVITGEGRMDEQSCHGKVAQGIGLRCKAQNKPVIALVGSIGDGAEAMYDYGISSIVSTVPGPVELSYAMEHAEEFYLQSAERMFKAIQVGTMLK